MAASTRADVRRSFPADAVRDEEIELDEGALRAGTLVFKDPVEKLAIFWDSEKTDAHPREVFLCFGRRQGPCRWRTLDGIQVGTTLRDLEKKNGKPFTVSPFGWDYGGNVLSWGGGSLGKLDCNGRLTLTLDAQRVRAGEYATPLTAEESHAVSKGPEVSSDSPAMQKLNPTVTGMLLKLAGPDPGRCISK